MTQLQIVRPDDHRDEITVEDLARLAAATARLRALVDNPLALIERAQALLEGRAEPLI